MAEVRLSDVIVPEIFYNYMVKDTTTKTDLFTSGVIRSDSELGTKLAGGGTTFNVPFWKDLGDEEAGIASDDPALLSTPAKISTGKDIAVRQYRTKSWSTMDLTGELAGSDPMQRIVSRVNQYWDRQNQDYFVNTARGIYLSNVANNSSDMVSDISSDSSDAVGAGQLVSAEAIIDAAYTLGDQAEGIRAFAMHSTVAKRLNKLDLIDFRQDSSGSVTLVPYYMGKRVIVNDKCFTVSGTNRIRYTTYLFGEGVFGHAESPVATPVEVERKPDAGNGAGQEILYTRRQFALHPYGIKWTGTSMAGLFPTNAELATATNWTRVYAERKQIPLAFLVTNG